MEETLYSPSVNTDLTVGKKFALSDFSFFLYFHIYVCFFFLHVLDHGNKRARDGVFNELPFDTTGPLHSVSDMSLRLNK